MSKNQNKPLLDLLSNMIDKELPAIMDAIMKAEGVSADLKASRVGLASTALHHLKLLKAALS